MSQKVLQSIAVLLLLKKMPIMLLKVWLMLE